MRLPEKCFEWQVGRWQFGITLCPGTWAVMRLVGWQSLQSGHRASFRALLVRA